jgi:hypothetical protein
MKTKTPFLEPPAGYEIAPAGTSYDQCALILVRGKWVELNSGSVIHNMLDAAPVCRLIDKPAKVTEFQFPATASFVARAILRAAPDMDAIRNIAESIIAERGVDFWQECKGRALAILEEIMN